ncbi:MAG: 4Fe-4S dicluster domain-containing protein [Dehalococcoidales bacterium]|nr:4Fe-4S dicluster domain-containing protein [Dehalococcoidales bacterium]
MTINKILVVDDEAIVRESIRDWLKLSDFDVSTAESGEEALEMIGKEDYNIMVLDLRLPGESGLSVLAKAKETKPGLKSIIITAYPTEDAVAEAKELGAIDYLIKPLAPEDLEKLIRDTITSMDQAEVAEDRKAPGEQPFPALKLYSITGSGLKSLIEGLIREREVIGPMARQGKFIFEKISRFEDMVLDYDVSLLPPSKFLFPAKETLLKFNVERGPQFQPVVDTQQRALVGIHPDDINAIELLDDVFMKINPDPNYITRRLNTLIIGVDCLHPASEAFAPSMGTNIADSGFDLLLTDIGIGFVVTVGTKKGLEILNKYAAPREVTGEEIARQKEVRDEAALRYRHTLEIPKERLLKLLQDNYENPYWEFRARTCLSCGSCVMVCPTCFCFDVQDEMELNMIEGERYRNWDGCVLIDFAKVASGENFRHTKGSRFRHRILRKGKYILEKYGRVGCVGCGRCATECLAKIASPVEAFNAIAESERVREEARQIVHEAELKHNIYLPHLASLVRVRDLGQKEKVFDFKFIDGRALGHKPGQFVEVSIPGIGESPISISSSPTRGETFQLAIRNVGSVTNALHNLKEGQLVGIRGPFGNGFPVDKLDGKDLLLIAGGIGLFPLRSLIQYVLDKRERYGRVILLAGSRSPAERMFVEELDEWNRNPSIEFMETVDKADEKWTSNVGVITTLISRVRVETKNTVAVVVGPPVMYRFVINELKKTGLADEHIIFSLERRMKCGVGKCGHCQINGVYVCQEGPVFTLEQLRGLREAVL